MSIEIKNLTYVYSEGTPFEKKALDDVSVTIKKGSFVGLIGHTGSGKSTLIQHLNALMKPASGSILIDGEDINSNKQRLKAIRQKVGLVFQYPEHQLFEMTLLRDVAYGPENYGATHDEAMRMAREALELVGIDSSLHEKSPFELSGGQRRRVAIAGVLAMSPSILILDEPTAGLDPHGRDEILSKIKDMHKRLGITVILVSHSMEDIARLVDEIIVMYRGKIALMGTPKEIFTHTQELEKMGLAAPQVSYLVDALIQNGFDLTPGTYNIDKAVDAIASCLTNNSGKVRL